MTEETPQADLWRDLIVPFCFGSWAGTVRVLGTPPPSVLGALLAFTTGTLDVDRQGEPLLWPESPIPHRIDPLDADSILSASLVVWGGGGGIEPKDLDLGLRFLCHEGPVLMALGAQKGTKWLQNILEAACYPPIFPAVLPSLGVTVRTGHRDAPHGRVLNLPYGKTLSHTVVIIARGHSAALEDLLCDLLMRTTFPPTQVMVMDISEQDEEAAPPHLYGIPENSPTEVFLAQPGPIDEVEVVFDALSGADGRLFTVLSAEDRCAPNWARFADHFTESEIGAFAFEGIQTAPRVRNRGGLLAGVDRIRGRTFSADWLRLGGLDRLLSGRIRKLKVISTQVPLLHLASSWPTDEGLPRTV